MNGVRYFDLLDDVSHLDIFLKDLQKSDLSQPLVGHDTGPAHHDLMPELPSAAGSSRAEQAVPHAGSHPSSTAQPNIGSHLRGGGRQRPQRVQLQPAGRTAVSAVTDTCSSPPSSGLNRSSSFRHDRTSRAEPRTSSSSPTMEDRKARTKLKNRLAQCKFRAKQKSKLAESETRVEELAAALRRLQVENSQLAQRNGLLEKAVTLQSQPSSAAPAHEAADELDMAAVSPALPGCLPGNLPRQMAAVINMATPMHFICRDGQELQLTAEDVKRMPWNDLCQLWKEYVNQAAAYLTALPSSATYEQLTRAVSDMSRVLCCLGLTNPRGFRAFFCLKLDESAMAPPPTPECWRRVTRALDLTGEQRAVMLAQRRVYLAQQAATLRERAGLLAALRLPPGGLSMARTGEWYLGSADGLEALRSNLAEEHRHLAELLGHVCGAVFTPRQMAICAVQVYPWAPDTVAVVEAVAAEEGEPPAQAVLHCSSSFADAAALQSLSAAWPPAALGLQPASAALPGVMPQGLDGLHQLPFPV